MDSKLCIWYDCTKQDQEEDEKQENLRLVKEQELRNALRSKEYTSAIILALELEQPRR